MKRKEVFDRIDRERWEQGRKWGDPHPWGIGDCSNPDIAPLVKVAVLSEECGEVARAVLDRNDGELKAELVQVAAVAVAWLESL